LSEYLFPRCLAVLIYNTQGSELGSIKTTFKGKMYQWLYATKQRASRCVYDPICGSRAKPCVGCMHIPERNCPEFNEELSRRSVVTVDIKLQQGEESQFVAGYWE
jgi:hypothetical protein